MRKFLIIFFTTVSAIFYGQVTDITSGDTTTITYKVEFERVSLPLNLNEAIYKDLPSVEYRKDKKTNLFYYTSGYFKNITDATKHKDKLISYGLSKAHVVAIKNNRQIRLEDIAKYD